MTLPFLSNKRGDMMKFKWYFEVLYFAVVLFTSIKVAGDAATFGQKIHYVEKTCLFAKDKKSSHRLVSTTYDSINWDAKICCTDLKAESCNVSTFYKDFNDVESFENFIQNKHGGDTKGVWLCGVHKGSMSLHPDTIGCWYPFSFDGSDMDEDGVKSIWCKIYMYEDPELEWASLSPYTFWPSTITPPNLYVPGLGYNAATIYFNTHDLEIGSYPFQFSVCTGYGQGIRTCISTCVCTLKVIPYRITDLTAVEPTGTSKRVELRWSLPATGNCVLSRLCIYRMENDSITIDNVNDAVIIADSLPVSDTLYVDTTGSGGKQYYYAVYGYDADDNLIVVSNSPLADYERTSFSLISPLDGSVVNTLRPTFDWEDAINSTFTLWYSTDSTFTERIEVANLTESQYTPTEDLQDHATYYWKVSAVGGAYPETTWCNETGWSFGTNATNVAPANFSLLYPANGDTIESLRPIFRWEAAFDPGDNVTYTIWYGTDSTFATRTEVAGLTTTKFIPCQSLLQDTIYYWKVKAVDSEGLETWCNEGFWSFVVDIDDPPVPFSKLYPYRWLKGNSIDSFLLETGLRPTFDWEDSYDPDGGSITYTLWYTTDSTFTNKIVVTGIDTSEYTPTTDLEENTLYYWNVFAVDEDGDTTWSRGQPWGFVTNAENENPVPFSLLCPANGDTIRDFTPTFEWESASDPDPNDVVVYALWYSRDSTFASKREISPIGFTTTEYTMPRIKPMWHKDTYNSYSGNSWWCGDPSISGYQNNWYQVLTTPDIDLTSATPPVVLSFMHYYETEGPNFDGGNIRISTDGGATFSVLTPSLGSYDTDSLWAFNYHGDGVGIPGYCGNSGGWILAEFDLSSFIGDTIRIQFVFASDEYTTSQGWFLDNITIADGCTTYLFDDGGDTQSAGLRAQAGLISGVTYYWKVKALDIWCDEPMEGETWCSDGYRSFTFKNDPPTPFSLIMPADGDTVYTLTPTFDWEDSFDPDSGAVTYTLWYSGLSDFRMKKVITDISTSEYTPSSNLDHKFIFWGEPQDIGIGRLYWPDPAFVDIDADGDYDLFIGDQYGNIWFVENIGNPDSAVWASRILAFTINGSDASPTFCDIDADGDFDMFIGEFYSGGIFFVENIGTPSSPVWASPVENYGNINVGRRSAPAFSDIDGDGDYDLFVGNQSGAIYYYENIGTDSQPVWAEPVLEPISVKYYANPCLVDMDADGDDDMVVRNYDGRSSSIRYFENLGNHNWEPSDAVSVGNGPPALCDLDNDGDFDLLTGTTYYENLGTIATLPTYWKVQAWDPDSLFTWSTQNDWKFNINVDVSSPHIVSTSPADGEIDVPLSDSVIVIFDEEMNPSTINDTTFVVNDGVNNISGTILWDSETKRAIFIPDSAFHEATIYTATVSKFVEDTAGNRLYGPCDYSWSFTTFDTTPPNVLNPFPPDGARTNDTLQVIRIDIEDVSGINEESIIFEVEDVPYTISDSGLVYSEPTLIFNPANVSGGPIIFSDSQVVNVSLIAVEDNVGNALQSPYSWSFTVDITPPEVVNTSPPDSATNVPIPTIITAIFNEQMDASTLDTTTIILFTNSDTIRGLVTYDSSTYTVTYIPLSHLLEGVTYTVTITTGVKDLAGNRLLTDYSWIFTTQDSTPPTVYNPVPPNGTRTPDTLQTISINITDPGGINVNTIVLQVEDSIYTITDSALSYDGTLLTFTPAYVPLIFAHGQVVNVSLMAVEDNSGNGIASPVNWSFIVDTTINVITVDDDGGANYTAIQPAIDAALPGDIVEVAAGTYNENITITKRIELRGEDRNTTIINGDGNGNVVYISADSVYIHGFTIKNGNIGIYLDSSNYSYIANNRIVDNTGKDGIPHRKRAKGRLGAGIYLCASNANQIVDNIVSNNKGGNGYGGCRRTNPGGPGVGIYLRSATENVVVNNTISDNKGGNAGSFLPPDYADYGSAGGIGAGIYLSSSTNNIFLNNTILNSVGGVGAVDGPGYGVYIDSESYNNILDRTNRVDGEPIIYFYQANGPQVIQNEILVAPVRTTNLGKIALIECSNFQITNNIISNYSGGNAGGDGDTIRWWSYKPADIGAGIYVSMSLNITIANNNISNIEGGNESHVGEKGGIGTGIYVSQSDSISILENTISTIKGGSSVSGAGGAAAGVYLSSCNSVIVSNNLINSCMGGAGGSSKNPYGFVVDGGDGGFGIGLYLAATVASLTNNVIKDNVGGEGSAGYNGGSPGSNGIGIGIYCTDSASVSIGGSLSLANDIYGNSSFELYNNTEDTIFATYNYWGTEIGDTVAEHIYDFYDDSTKGIVIYSPWIDSSHSFTFPPNIPTLIYPPDSATINNNTPEFVWSSTAGEAGSYTLEYALDSLFTQGVVTVSDLSETTYISPTPLADTTYYWHVKAIDRAANESGYQEYPFMFTIDTDIPDVPILLAPGDSSCINDNTPTFIWTEVTFLSKGSKPEELSDFDIEPKEEVETTRGIYLLDQKLEEPIMRKESKLVGKEKDSHMSYITRLACPGNSSSFSSPITYTLQVATNLSFDSLSLVIDTVGLIKNYFTPTDSLPDTTYYWRVEAVDRAGNHSGYQEHPFMFTIISLYDISGNVNYYSNDNPVENTTMILSGDAFDTTATDTSGYYIFNNLQAKLNYTITPNKITATHPDPAISAYDAALVLRHIVGLDTLNEYQQTAGDVSGNGELTSYDAALILQYVVTIIDSFPVGADWTFEPESLNYEHLSGDQTGQDYIAILYGDVSGNWSSSGGNFFACKHSDDKEVVNGLEGLLIKKATEMLTVSELHNSSKKTLNRKVDKSIVYDAVSSQSKNIAKVTIDTISCSLDKNITVPINVNNAEGIISADITLTYDPKVVIATKVSTTSFTSDYLIAYKIMAGEIRIALAGSRPLRGNGPLVNVTFDAAKEVKVGDESPLTLAHVSLNEGNIRSTNTSGMLTISFISNGAMESTAREIPKKFILYVNYPNPFCSETKIRYALPEDSDVTLKIYDITGQLVRVLVDELQEAGYYTVSWDGKDKNGREVPSGIYFYRIEAGSFVTTRKAVLLRLTSR